MLIRSIFLQEKYSGGYSIQDFFPNIFLTKKLTLDDNPQPPPTSPCPFFVGMLIIILLKFYVLVYSSDVELCVVVL